MPATNEVLFTFEVEDYWNKETKKQGLRDSAFAKIQQMMTCLEQGIVIRIETAAQKAIVEFIDAIKAEAASRGWKLSRARNYILFNRWPDKQKYWISRI